MARREKVNPDLVVHDAEGKVYTVRYDAVNAMLLNEFLKKSTAKSSNSKSKLTRLPQAYRKSAHSSN